MASRLEGIPLLLAAALVACGAEATSPAPDAKSAGSPAAVAKTPAPASPSSPPPAPATSSLIPFDPAQEARVGELAARFRGGKACDAEAFAELRELHERHGPVAPLRDVLLMAFDACEARVAKAELMAAVLPDAPTPEDRLRLGAAWLRASRYADAVDVLLPLANEQGHGTKSAWLAGFALFHAGRSDEALPWLEGARNQVGGGNVTDAPLLIGLSHLHAGRIDQAIAELEAGRQAAPDNRSLLSALARAYTAAGRAEDAAAVSARAQQLADATAQQERTRSRLAALSSALNAARTEGRTDDADRIIDQMLPLAPAEARPKLLAVRIKLYEAAGRAEDAAAVRQQIAAGGTP